MGTNPKWKQHETGPGLEFWFSGVECPTPGKRTFGSRRDAKTALNRWWSKTDTPKGKLAAYRCECGGFHVGSQIMDRDTARRVAAAKLRDAN